jgi:hypothetical protein
LRGQGSGFRGSWSGGRTFLAAESLTCSQLCCLFKAKFGFCRGTETRVRIKTDALARCHAQPLRSFARETRASAHRQGDRKLLRGAAELIHRLLSSSQIAPHLLPAHSKQISLFFSPNLRRRVFQSHHSAKENTTCDCALYRSGASRFVFGTMSLQMRMSLT